MISMMTYQTCTISMIVANMSSVTSDSMFAHVTGNLDMIDIDRELRLNFGKDRVSYPVEIHVFEKNENSCGEYERYLDNLKVRLYEKPVGNWFNTELSKDGHYQVKLIVVDESSIRQKHALTAIRSFAFLVTIISLIALIRSVASRSISFTIRTLALIFIHALFLACTWPPSTTNMTHADLRSSRHIFDRHLLATRLLYMYMAVVLSLCGFDRHLSYWHKDTRYVRPAGRLWIVVLIIMFMTGSVLEYMHTLNSVKICQPYAVKMYHMSAYPMIARAIYVVMGITSIAISMAVMPAAILAVMMYMVLYMTLESMCVCRPLDGRMMADYWIPAAALWCCRYMQVVNVVDRERDDKKRS